MGHIGFVGRNPALRQQLDQQLGPDFALTAPAESEQLFEHIESGRAPFDAVLLELTSEDAVRLAQRIYTYDKLIPVLILTSPSTSEELKRVLMFSPFLGNEVIAWSTDDIDILPATLREVISRRRQRLKHRNILSTAQIRLEKLPFQQPDATHYLDRLLDRAPVGVVTVDLSGTLVTLNRQAQNILANTERRLLGRPLVQFFPTREHQRLTRLQEACSADAVGQRTEIFELDTKSGQRRYVEVSLAPLTYRTGQRGFMLILQDVTARVEAEQERQRAETELRRHAALLRKFHEITSSESLSLEEKLDQVLVLGCEQFRLSIGILSRIDGNHLSVLRAVGGDSAYSIGSRHKLDLTYCGTASNCAEPLTVTGADSEKWKDHPAFWSSGHRSYIGTRLCVDDGVQGTLCFFDYTPRERPFNAADSELIKLMSRWVGNELQRERADALMRKLSGALERTADAIMITDRNRYIEYVNPSFVRLTGYTRDEAIGHKTYFLRSGLHDRKYYDELWEVIGKGNVYRGTLVNRKKNGALYYEQKTISPLKDESGAITHFISSGHDITELIEAEEKNRAHHAELAHVARLSTLGEMTSGLAHELNQPLCAITTYAQTCLHIVNGDDCSPGRVRYGLEQIVKQAGLASAIFRRLRDFSRKGEIRSEPVCMAKVVKEVLDFVTAEAHQKLVKLHHRVPADVPNTMGDAIQIEQVLLNLVRNAMDAVVELEETRRHIFLSAQKQRDGWLTMEIRDRGRGCPADMADRLFEPFVTSRKEGLGIGLSISQGIVEAHGGRLWLAKNSKTGAVFRFTLPTASSSGEKAKA
jgi:PAS domain S-box-containing protein